jgi:hypothetical protein
VSPRRHWFRWPLSWRSRAESAEREANVLRGMLQDSMFRTAEARVAYTEREKMIVDQYERKAKRKTG